MDVVGGGVSARVVGAALHMHGGPKIGRSF